MFINRLTQASTSITRRAATNIRNNATQQQQQQQQLTARAKSSSSPLAGDSGHKATHLHHHMTTLLALATPLYLFSPTSPTTTSPNTSNDYTSTSMLDKSFGLLFATTISAHSWIGLNYVATDYIPKISKALVGPARIVNVGLGVVTFLGLSTIAFNERGGLKGCVKGLWRPIAVAVVEEDEKKTE